jgi:hypothetical protein
MEVFEIASEIEELSSEGDGSIYSAALNKVQCEFELECLTEAKKQIKDMVTETFSQDMAVNRAQLKATNHEKVKEKTNQYLNKLLETLKHKARHQQKRDRYDALIKLLSLEQSQMKFK